MTPSILMFFMVVIGCARASTHTSADQGALPTADQGTCARADGGPDADALRSFLFARLGVPPLNGSCISAYCQANGQ